MPSSGAFSGPAVVALIACAAGSSAEASAQTFQPGVFLDASAPERIGVAVADLDGDGDLDVVSTHRFPGEVTWLENRGDGAALGSRAIGVPPPPSGPLGAPAVVDLDLDGDLDVLSSRFNALGLAPIHVHENLGAGRFGPPTALPGPTADVHLLTPTDLDGDGDVDLVFARDRTTIVVRERLGGGVFAAPQVLVPGNQMIEFLDVVDLDGDGALDIVFAEEVVERVRWARGTGGLTVGPPSLLIDPLVSGGVGAGAADLDGDGDLDVYAVRATGEVLVREALGAGAFGPQQSVAAAASSAPFRAAAAVDLDGDGASDLIFASDSAIERRLAVGGLAFGTPVARPIEGTLAVAPSVGAADLDGDGDLDPWFASGLVHWCPGDGAGGMGAARVMGRRGGPSFGLAVGDFDGDGALEGVGASGEDAVVADDFASPEGDALTGRPIDVVLSAESSFLAVDHDGDGDEDVLVAVGNFHNVQSGVALIENTGSGLAPGGVVFMTDGDGPGVVQLGDVDGVGPPDLLLAHPGPFSGGAYTDYRWVTRAGAGPPVGHGVRLVASGRLVGAVDLDQDGLPDVIAQRPTGGSFEVVVMRTLPGGDLAPPAVVLTYGGASTQSITVRAGDVDGDGLADLALVDGVTGEAAVAPGLGGAAFSAPVPVAPPVGASVESLALEDLDDDGDLDVAIAYRDRVRVLENLGNGAFAAPFDTDPAEAASARGELVAVDVDADSDLDLVQLTPRGPLLYRSVRRLGRVTCLDGAVGSNGLRPRISARGSDVAADRDLTLLADRLPPLEFGIFLVADGTGVTPMAGGIGTLCLGGAIGRINQPGQIRQADASGVTSLDLDLTLVPTPSGFEAITAGDTRHFQYWTRDRTPAPTSNLSSALELRFR